MSEYYEKQIINGIKEGKDSAFRSLYDLYYTRLFCIARQYLQDSFIAETIVSDVFFHLWEVRDTLDIQTSLNAYLIRAVRNHSVDYLRKNFVEKEVSLDGPDAVSPLLFLSDEYPLGQLLEKELTEKIYQAIDKLPAETRRVFVLSKLDGIKQEVIADKLGITVHTVKYHMKQAVSLLREQLKGYWTMLIICLLKFF